MPRKSVSWGALLFFLLFPLFVGTIAGFLIREQLPIYQSIQKPPFAPPPILFPIIWTILYLLMGYSAYLVFQSQSTNRQAALSVFFLQLLCNFFWPLIFFNLQAYLTAFLWLVTLFLLVLYLSILFCEISVKASLLLLPYLLWLLFAGYLNFGVYLLNRPL